MTQPSTTVTESIRMGEMAVCAGGSLRTLVGSCIGVALYDRKQKLGGLAHVVLPDSRGSSETQGKYADTAIPLLISQIKGIAHNDVRLSAKIAGGANMFSSSSTLPIGEQNVDAVESVLAALRIPVVGRDCGGAKGRRLTVDVTTGDVFIEIVGADTLRI